MDIPKLKELKSIHSWIRETSNSETFFVALLVFPIVLKLYSLTLKSIEFNGLNYFVTIGIVSFLYIISIIIMKNSQTNDEEMEIDWLIIKSHSKTFEKEYIRFEKLLEKDKKYTEKYLKKLIRKYPDEIIIANFGQEQNKHKGLKLLRYSIIQLE